MMFVAEPLAYDLDGVAAVTTLSPALWKQLVREGKAPAPRQLSGRRVVWLADEIKAWLASRPVSELLPPENTGNRKRGST